MRELMIVVVRQSDLVPRALIEKRTETAPAPPPSPRLISNFNMAMKLYVSRAKGILQPCGQLDSAFCIRKKLET